MTPVEITLKPPHKPLRKPFRVLGAANRDRLVRLIAKGVPITHACAALRISYSWLCKYRTANPGFQEQIDEAVGRAIEKHISLIVHAAEHGDTASSRWFLERCHPQHFARTRVELTGENGGPIAGAVITLQWPHQQTQPRHEITVENRPALPAPDAG